MEITAIPGDIVEFLQRISTGQWGKQIIVQEARKFVDDYGLERVQEPPVEPQDDHLRRNTAALLEWLEGYPNQLRPVGESMLISALLGDLPAGEIKEWYEELIHAKREEAIWKSLISKIESSYGETYSRTITDGSYRETTTIANHPKARTLQWLNKNLQTARENTLALATRAVRANLSIQKGAV